MQFPTGVGAKGNDGVAGVIKSTSGAIGYVSLSYDFANGLQYAVRPQRRRAVRGAEHREHQRGGQVGRRTCPASNSISIVNPSKAFPKAYPMSTFTYALVPAKSPKADMLKPFLTYAITTGQKFGAKLAFAPLPAKILTIDKATIAKISAS